jgi:hypothetical protein
MVPLWNFDMKSSKFLAVPFLMCLSMYLSVHGTTTTTVLPVRYLPTFGTCTVHEHETCKLQNNTKICCLPKNEWWVSLSVAMILGLDKDSFLVKLVRDLMPDGPWNPGKKENRVKQRQNMILRLDGDSFLVKLVRGPHAWRTMESWNSENRV